VKHAYRPLQALVIHMVNNRLAAGDHKKAGSEVGLAGQLRPGGIDALFADIGEHPEIVFVQMRKELDGAQKFDQIHASPRSSIGRIVARNAQGFKQDESRLTCASLEVTMRLPPLNIHCASRGVPTQRKKRGAHSWPYECRA